MPNETSNAEKLLNFQREYAEAVAKVDPKNIAKLKRMADNFEMIKGNFNSDDLFAAAQLGEAQRLEAEAAEGKSMGGMMQYNMGGSMLVPPEREGYSAAGEVAKRLIKAFTKTPIDKQLVQKAQEVHKSVEDLSMQMPKKEAIEQTSKELDMPISSIKRFEEHFAREAGGGKTDTFFDEIKQTYKALTREGTQGQQAAAEFGGGKETRASRIKGAKFFGTGNVTGALGIGAPLGVAGTTAYNSLTDTESGDNEERINPEDYPVYKKGTESAKSFREAQRKAKKEKADFFEWEGREYNVKEAKNMGGKMKYAEGGSLLDDPEREEYFDGGTAIKKLFGAATKVARPIAQGVKQAVKVPTEIAGDIIQGTATVAKRGVKGLGTMGGKLGFTQGQPDISFAEGGSMLMPPEMEADQEMPVDTYDNIPEDEKEEAEASQLPDEEMEDGYLDFVLKESLDQEDQDYLMSVLEGDERLSSIFDKVMDVAGEFSGEGEVDGPGTGVSDSIPARLSDGEFVFTKKATDQMGADNLQSIMDEAEMAYDGGYMKKAFGGLTLDPMQDEKQMYGMDQMKSTQDELRKQMLGANRMPSVRQG